jgi:hypothetical protein
MLSVMKLNKENDRKNNKLIQTASPVNFSKIKDKKKMLARRRQLQKILSLDEDILP